ncbi:sensor domain-containing diguanylate cyclase [Leptolyngbya sp. PCC 6406]|uniref:sensor domain-containing diguanylate cyclase n=1 Tax=Leptolyngbya sp. PCC 6406 TaxID=1173264 RepID=UPI0002ABA689|nr:sensor domain-containing diguanylate cyclase [Leptolyngbya sp. PCC 6406]
MDNTIQSYESFSVASSAVLSLLRDRLGFDLWMMTRTIGEDWIVLQAENGEDGYGVQAGDVFRWSDSFCARMVQGQGPCVAADVSEVPVYAKAPIAQQLPIGAYIGVPLRHDDGKLFGTLCAIHPEPMDSAIAEQQSLIEMLARLLCSLLEAEMGNIYQRRRAERAEAESLIDSLTQTYNRRGWDYLLATEEECCRQYGHPACVMVVDLDNLKHTNDTLGHTAGDALLQRAAKTLQGETRSQDVVARLGGDEFAVLGIEIDHQAAQALLHRLQTALDRAAVPASIGLAICQPYGSLKETWQAADAAMYAQKQTRKQQGEVRIMRPGSLPV